MRITKTGFLNIIIGILFVLAFVLNINSVIFGGVPSIIGIIATVFYAISWYVFALKVDFDKHKMMKYVFYTYWSLMLIFSLCYIVLSVIFVNLDFFIPIIIAFFTPFGGFDFANSIFYITGILSILVLATGIYKDART